MSATLTEEQIEILKHIKRTGRYVTDPNEHMARLLELEFITDVGSVAFTKNGNGECMHYYLLCPSGEAFLSERETRYQPPMTTKARKSKERYARYLTYGSGFKDFMEYTYWDAHPDRSWNQ